MSQNKWQLTVGMEVHIELKTNTKMFCSCRNDPFNSAPNEHICSVCYGLPGALPLLNREAIKKTVLLGRALKGEISPLTYWERKNYYYPDLPKGYQISQSVLPLIKNGRIAIDGMIHCIEHIHLEEDAGKLMHRGNYSLADYNRAGVPLIELVTEPDFTTATQAKRFCEELQRISRALKISDADMEKGQMRCEANISVSLITGPNKSKKLGTKVEVKNLNSFKSVERSIEYEYHRQVKILENGGKVKQETRTFNDDRGETMPMRSKEVSADYRYFPEPDLPAVEIEDLDSVKEVTLPEDRRQELIGLGLTIQTAQTLVDKGLSERVVEFHAKEPDFIKDFAHLLMENSSASNLDSDQAVEVLRASRQNGWTKDFVAKVIDKLCSGYSFSKILEQSRLEESLDEIISEVIDKNPQALADYQNGKEAAFNYLVGQVMSAAKGKANIGEVRTKLQQILSSL